MKKSKSILLLIISASLLQFEQPAFAQPTSVDELSELRAKNLELEKRIAALEALLQVHSPTKDEPEKLDPPGAPVNDISSEEDADEPTPSTPANLVADTSRQSIPSVGGRQVAFSAPPGTADRPLQGGGVGIQFDASSGGGRAALTIARSVRRSNVAPNQVKASGLTWSITASAPLADSGDTAIGTLDSFTSASQLRVRLGKLNLTMPNLLNDPEFTGLENAAISACQKAAGADAKAKSACETALIDLAFVDKHLPSRSGDFVRLTTTQRSAWGYGIQGSIGYREFEFVDSDTLASEDSDEIPWDIGVYGTLLPQPGLSFTGMVQYQSGFDEQDPVVICPTPGAAAFSTCLSGPNGRPDDVEKVLLSLGGRHLWDLSRSPLQNGIIDRFGIAPQLTYDANNDEFGVDFPIYFAPDDKGNLIGGVRFGYSTEENSGGFNVGVFVGSAFDLFGK